MRTVSKAQVPILLPSLLAMGRVACGWYLLELRIEAPVAWVVMCVLVLASVFLAAMQRQVLQCDSCRGRQPMTPEEEAQVTAAEKSAERDRLRVQLLDEVRSDVRSELRPVLESELRP